ARGLSAGSDTMLSAGAEENILCYEHDRWRGENIFVHECGHTIKKWGLEPTDASFAGRVRAAYEAAMAGGLYRGVYASTNAEEYWAEGVQAYFAVSAKAQLLAEDPALFGILASVFADVVLPGCPSPALEPGTKYRIQNVALGSAQALAAVGSNPAMVRAENDAKQRWRFSSLGGGRGRVSSVEK